jgi:hypothetical protein
MSDHAHRDEHDLILFYQPSSLAAWKYQFATINAVNPTITRIVAVPLMSLMLI